MTNPIDVDAIVESQYKDFNELYKKAETGQGDVGKIAEALFKLQGEIIGNLEGATPGKFSKDLPKELAVKVGAAYDKAFTSAPSRAKPSVSPSPGPGPSAAAGAVKGIVGFSNAGANCWANSLLQMLLHTPEHADMLQTVGDFYAQGKCADRIGAIRAITYFQNPEPNMDEGIAMFCSIGSIHWKLVVLRALLNVGYKDLERLIAADAGVEKTLAGKPLEATLIALCKKGEGAEEDRAKKAPEAGTKILTAIEQYANHCALGEPVPAVVSQGVREAFHHLYGAKAFSAEARHEDVSDALASLMSSYEQILKITGKFPSKIHSALQTRLIYTDPMGAPRPQDLTKTRSKVGDRLEKNEFEYHINLELIKSDPEGITVEQLLDRFFVETPIPTLKPEDRHRIALINPDGQEQDYPIVRVERQFTGRDAPPVLTAVISRTPDGSKIRTSVIANRIVTLPAHSTTQKRELAYALESFAVHLGAHSGGHYMAYRRLPEGWVEFDDGRTRPVSEVEIDRILWGQTPYVLSYRLVPESRQAEMLALSKSLRSKAKAAIASAPAKKPVFAAEGEKINKTVELLVEMQKAKDNDSLKESMRALLKLNPEVGLDLRLCVGIHGNESVEDRSSEAFIERSKALTSDLMQLTKINVGWIRPKSGNLLEQMLKREREKHELVGLGAQLKVLDGLINKATPELALQLFPARTSMLATIQELSTRDLSAYLDLLKTGVNNRQLVQVFNHILKLPEAEKQNLFKLIAKELGGDVAKAEAEFEKNPRVLLTPSKGGASEPLDFLGAFDLSPSKKSILEVFIDSLKK